MSTGIAQAAALAVSLATARLLGAVGYGELAIVNSTMGTLGIFAGLGLGLTSTKYVAQLRVADPARAGVILGLVNRAVLFSAIILCTGLFALSPFLAAHVLNAPQLVPELQLGCLLLLFNEINGVQVGSLAGYEAFRAIARVNLLRGLAALPIGILGAWTYGVQGAVGAAVLVAAIGVSLSHVALDREARKWGIHITTRGARRELAVLWRFSLPAFLGTAVVGPAGWIGNALLVNQPNGYSQLGIFNAANQWRTTIMFFPTVVAQAALPILSSLFSHGRSRSTRRVLAASVVISALTAIPIAALLILLNGQVMALYGPGFAMHGAVLVIVAATVIILAIQTPVGQLIAASGRMWLGAAMNFGWSVAFLVAGVALVSSGHGAIGLASAYLIAYLIHSLWTLLYGFIALRAPERAAPTAPMDPLEPFAPGVEPPGGPA